MQEADKRHVQQDKSACTTERQRDHLWTDGKWNFNEWTHRPPRLVFADFLCSRESRERCFLLISEFETTAIEFRHYARRYAFKGDAAVDGARDLNHSNTLYPCVRSKTPCFCASKRSKLNNPLFQLSVYPKSFQFFRLNYQTVFFTPQISLVSNMAKGRPWQRGWGFQGMRRYPFVSVSICQAVNGS